MAARRKSVLTEKQAEFIDAKMLGLSTYAAGEAANANGASMMASKNVVAEIEAARAYITDLTTLKRLDVIQGIMESIDMARMMSDPSVMIKGWTEVAKILGHYAPEVKQINISHNQGKIRAKYEALSDEELLAIAEGVQVIDGEITD